MFSALVFLSSMIFVGCQKSSTVEHDLQTIAQSIRSTSNLESRSDSLQQAPVNDDDDDEQPSISLHLARQIVYADVILQDILSPTSPPRSPNGGSGSTAEKLMKTEAYQNLVSRAKAVLGNSFAVSKEEVAHVSRLSLAERAVIQAQAEATLTQFSKELQLAGVDDALERLLRAESKLTTFAEDLRDSVKKIGSSIPRDPLALIPLPPPEILEKVIAGIEIRERRLTELLAITRDPQIELSLKSISSQLARMKQVKISAERRTFSAERATLFKNIEAEKWSTLTTTRQARAESNLRTLRHELETSTGYRELKVAANGIRGPPDPVGDMIFHSIRSYDIDPSGWTRNEARLHALASELTKRSTIPATLTSAPAIELDLLASALSDEKLAAFRDTITRIRLHPSEKMPSDYLFSDKDFHHEQWQFALEREAVRRAEGTNYRPIAMDPTISQTVKQYAFSEPLPTKLAEQHFLQILDYRFPNRDSMPLGLRENAATILRSALSSSLDEAADLFKEYREVSDRLARSTTSAPLELMQNYERSRASLQATIYFLDRAFVQAEEFKTDVSDLKPKRDMIVSLLPVDRRWQPPLPPAEGSVPDGFPRPPAGADMKLRRYQPGLERELRNASLFVVQANEHLAAAFKATRDLDNGPVSYARQLGRVTASEADILKGRHVLNNTKVNADVRRLATEWVGRLDEHGKPYSFAEVKEPKQFKVVGGGIHLGEMAENLGSEDLRSATLIYNPDEGVLLSDRASGKRWRVIGREVDPTTLKALYRFATSGRNAALSIGWRERRETIAENLRRGQYQEVLVDPYLVDTAAGQDLIVADLVPWKLDKPRLPNGRPISFYREFGRRVTAFHDAAKDKLRTFVKTVNRYRPEDRANWGAKLQTMETSALTRTVWQFDTIDDEAIRWFSDRQEVELKAKYGEKLEESLRDQISSDSKTRGKWNSLPADRKEQVVQELLDHEIGNIVGEDKKKLELLSKDISRARQDLLLAELVESMPRIGVKNRAHVECWVAMERAKDVSINEITQFLFSIVNGVSLAVLRDDSVAFRLSDDGSVLFSTKLKYFYGTSFIEVSDQRIGVSTSRDDSAVEVDPLLELTSLVNANLDQLVSRYPPLRDVKRYAEIAAFFRWAIAAQKSGHLGLIDLGSLGNFPANDRKQFPTVDTIRPN